MSKLELEELGITLVPCTDQKNILEEFDNQICMLNNIFQDVNYMVMEQQPIIDDIEKKIETTKEEVIVAETEMVKAETYNKTNRMYYTVALGCVAVTPIGLVLGIKAAAIGAVCVGVSAYVAKRA
jgi:t-SNARE complex subunit (syntaxin)